MPSTRYSVINGTYHYYHHYWFQMLLSLKMGYLNSVVVGYLLFSEEIIIILSYHFFRVNFVLVTIGKFFINISHLIDPPGECSVTSGTSRQP